MTKEEFVKRMLLDQKKKKKPVDEYAAYVQSAIRRMKR
jgi:hypothetical protein